MSDFHTYSSWGRTRQPKNLAGPHRTMLHDAVTTLPTAAPTLATHGYATENQRFLHLYVKNTEAANNHQITVWGFSYASGQWAEVYDTAGNKIEITFNNIVEHHYIFEVVGIDRLYVRDTSSGGHGFHNTDRIAAAMTTF